MAYAAGQYIARSRNRYRAGIKFKSAVIHAHVIVDNRSVLGDRVVLFQGAKVINSSIGAFTYVQKNTGIYHASIGRYCSVSEDVMIGLATHPTHHVSTHPMFYSVDQPLPVKLEGLQIKLTEDQLYSHTTVGHDVWIGARSILLGGLSIGTGAIIAAGSVVTREVEPYSIVAGVPAKKVKMRFDESTVSKLLESNWWQKSQDWIEKNADKMHEIELLENVVKKEK